MDACKQLAYSRRTQLQFARCCKPVELSHRVFQNGTNVGIFERSKEKYRFSYSGFKKPLNDLSHRSYTLDTSHRQLRSAVRKNGSALEVIASRIGSDGLVCLSLATFYWLAASRSP
ncbi:uncharacterized protein LOC143146751 [Ptiloglossa arizonensis]|uniref:uncharacterized protein LOC143146751 n=1 Tax=Ptiloglossa arizonensis TaxID=3350558 RepID=UPI003F9F6428